MRQIEGVRVVADGADAERIPDGEMFEGIGHVEVEFLGKRYVLGCVEGEEQQAQARAERFETDTGEVLKAVSGDLDLTRAMLMSAILAYERIEQLEDEISSIRAGQRRA